MHVVYVSRELTPALRAGGIASYVWNTARYLSLSGHRVSIICANDDTRLSTVNVRHGIRIIGLSGGDFAVRQVVGKYIASPLDMLRAWSRFKSYRMKIVSALECLNKDDPIDIIEFPEYGAEAYYYARKQPIAPWLIRLHTPTLLDRATQARMRPTMRNAVSFWVGLKELETIALAPAISSCSIGLAKWVSKETGVDYATIEIINNSISIAEWGQMSTPNNIRNNSVLFAGSVSPGKGVKELLQSISLLNQKGHSIQLNIAGKLGGFGRKLRKWSKSEIGLQDNVRFLGQVSKMELAKLYSTSVSCFPSHWEAFAMVGLEAMAAGSVVIASKSGGFSEFIEDGVDGFLVESKSVSALVEVISKVLSLNISVQRDIQIAAQHKAAQYDSSCIVPRILRHYNKVIELF